MRFFTVFLLSALLMLAVPASAVDHTVQFQNHCSYEVSVVVQGGQQYVFSGDNKVYGACQCLPDNTCTPTTNCPAVACGEGNKNKCTKGTPLVDNGGFVLAAKTGTHTSTMEKSWQGTFWPRSSCMSDGLGNYTCSQELQNCRAYYDGQPKLECGGHGIALATKGEMNFDENGFDTYDVSAVDGFNIPMTIELVPGTYDASGIQPPQYACTKAGNGHNLIGELWSNLSADKLEMKNKAGTPIAIQSACAYASALNLKNNNGMNALDALTNMTCCIKPWESNQLYKENGNMKCDPNNWPQDINTARFFKHYFPLGYSYAYDDSTSTYVCKNKEADTIVTQYIVTFCPANEGERTTLPGQDEHIHVSEVGDPKPVTPVPTPVPVGTVAPTQTPVQRYNPASDNTGHF